MRPPIKDEIYEAARRLGIGSAELARQATGWYVEDTDRLGLVPMSSRSPPRPSRTSWRSPASSSPAGSPTKRGETRTLRVARFGDYGRLSGARPEDMTAQEPGPLKEDPRDFAL